jgi:hypothetical protein
VPESGMRQGGGLDVESISRVLLSKDSTNNSSFMVRGGKYMAKGKSLSIQYFMGTNERRT